MDAKTAARETVDSSADEHSSGSVTECTRTRS